MRMATRMPSRLSDSLSRQLSINTPAACVVLTLMVVVVLAPAQAQTFTTLHNFTGGADGAKSTAGVIQDKSGKLYGTTNNGGSGYGVVFAVNTASTERRGQTVWRTSRTVGGFKFGLPSSCTRAARSGK